MLTRKKPMDRGTNGLQRTPFRPAVREISRGSVPGAVHHAQEINPDRPQRLAERAQRAMKSALFTTDTLGHQKAAAAIAGQALTAIDSVVRKAVLPTAIPKEQLLRSEPYRRLVAAMPCACCHIHGNSQHAHENVGKGMGLKVDDRRGFPLCTVSPGRVGCHELFDQYKLVDGGREAHRLLGKLWAAETRKKIIEEGLWPKRLPLWKGDQDGNKNG